MTDTTLPYALGGRGGGCTKMYIYQRFACNSVAGILPTVVNKKNDNNIHTYSEMDSTWSDSQEKSRQQTSRRSIAADCIGRQLHRTQMIGLASLSIYFLWTVSDPLEWWLVVCGIFHQGTQF